MSTSPSQRSISLITYTSRLFAAHWALWVPNASPLNPSTSTPPTKILGKRIEVEGSPITGFTHNIQRNYDLSTDSRPQVLTFLGSTNAETVIDPPEGPMVESIEVTDVVEELALSVPAPGRSLRGAGDEVSGDRSGLGLY